MTNIVVQAEQSGDAAAISALTAAAFKGHPYSSGRESQIIDDLRQAGALSVSLVARAGDLLVGHVAASPVSLASAAAGWYGLGPLSVLPSHQKQGIGTRLMEEVLQQLKARGAQGCILVGHPDYYQRFGFVADPCLTVPGVPSEVTLCLRFTDNAVAGAVRFHPAFGV